MFLKWLARSGYPEYYLYPLIRDQYHRHRSMFSAGKRCRSFASQDRPPRSSIGHLVHGKHDSGDAIDHQPLPQSSTLTTSERMIFHRLSQDSEGRAVSDFLVGTPQHSFAKDHTTNSIEDEPLAVVFERAASDVKQIDPVTLPLSIQPELPTNTYQSQKNPHKLQELREQEDLGRVNLLLSSTDTDLGVWFILEKEVFSKLRALQESNNRQQSNSNAKSMRKTKPSSRHPQSITDLSVPEERIKEALSSEVSLLSIPQTNFASYCVTALRIFRTRFPYSPYAMNLLPTLKSLGPISYALGASTELYNELLYIRWVLYRDLHSCARILAEMLDRGVSTNICTHAVFQDAQTQRNNDLLQQQSPFLDQASTLPPSGPRIPSKPEFERGTLIISPWWLLDGIQSGWAKWEEAERQALAGFGKESKSITSTEVEDEEELSSATIDSTNAAIESDHL